MGKTLVILEVSRKQDYIFSSKRLRENAARSAHIRHVTGGEFLHKAAGALYGERNMVYSGGGHTVLQFDDAETATAFSRKVTEAALRDYDGLELFAKQMPFDPESEPPQETLRRLSAALEHKKSERRAAFRQMSFGFEQLDGETFLPMEAEDGETLRRTEAEDGETLQPPEGWEYPAEFERLAGDDNFIAVVHADGNAMGRRVAEVYRQQEGKSWESCREALRRFSDGIQRDFEDAFLETVYEVIAGFSDECTPPVLPIRPVILAGDDVCFVTAGKLGLECARIFLEKLAAKRNSEEGSRYAACAGVALVHQKYPFHQAYELAEELCGSAKKFGAALKSDGSISAMDWHIEFGQLKENLDELREEYETEDGCRLELRPVVVVLPPNAAEKRGSDAPGSTSLTAVRSYAFFSALCRSLQRENKSIARGKLKQLRTALKQGRVESRFFLHDKEIRALLDHAVTAKYRDDQSLYSLFGRMLAGEENDAETLSREAFCRLGNEKVERCLYFDAIELMDHCSFARGTGE